MFCENCGAKLKKEDKFCPECGQPVLNCFEEDEGFCPEEDTWNLADDTTDPKSDVFDWDDNSYKVPEASSKEEGKNKTVRWIIIAGSSAAILMIVVVLIFTMIKSNFVSQDSDIQVRTEKIQTLPGSSEETEQLALGEDNGEPAEMLTPSPTAAPVPTVTPEAVVTPAAPEVQVPVQASDDGHQPDFAEKTQPVVVESEDPAGGDYILPQSASVYLTLQDIENLTQEELFYARNEIYARHGRKFLDDSIQAYFNEKSWYTPLYEAEDFDARQDSFFNDYEKKNAEFILNYEKSKGYL